MEYRAGTLGDVFMSCRDTIHLICMYLEGKLSESVQLEIERHLEGCRDCRIVLDAATTTLDRYFGPSKVAENSRAA
jgi:hypothetical protein